MLKFPIAIGGAAAVILLSLVLLPPEVTARLPEWTFVNHDGTSLGKQTHYRVAIVEDRRVVNAVTVTGSVTPVALVLVSSQVSGQINDLYADFNSEVRRGDPIAQIDPLTFQIAVQQAEAEVSIGRANLLKSEIALRDAESDLERKETLQSRGAGSVVERTKTESLRDQARAQLLDATAKLQKADAALRQARADLDRSVIRSPVDGVVIHRNVEAGQTVAASLQAPTLFTIAQDLRDMQVNTSVAEGEIGKLRVGQRVEFTVDSHADRVFEAKVVQIRKQPQMTQNVVTYTVVAAAPNPDLLLMPGMTATAKIIIEEEPDALAVPVAALRFRPPGEPRGGAARIFVERNGVPTAVPVTPGISDGAFIHVKSDALRPGESVIVGNATAATRSSRTGGGRLVGGF